MTSCRSTAPKRLDVYQNASKRTCRTFKPTEIWEGMRKDAGTGELGRFVTGFGERGEAHGDGVFQLFQ